MKVIWTEPASHALEAIQDVIARENPRAAWEATQKIRATVTLLSDHPRLGRKGRVRGTYELVIVGLPYIVPYRVLGKQIHILSVFHTSRKWPDAFLRGEQ